MSWTYLSLVTDAELGQLEPEAVDSDSPWGATTWANPRAEAKRDLKIWLESDYSSVKAVVDKIRDRIQPDWVWGYTGAVYTDRTFAARDDTENDVPIATVFTTFGTDALYVGSEYEFDGLFVQMLSSLNAVTSTLTAKYWSGGAWTSLSATDGTSSSGKTFAKSGRITWTVPSAWEQRDINSTGQELFWVELTVSAALTAGTAARQVLPIRAPEGLKRVVAYLSLYHILNGLQLQAAAPDGWRDKAMMYWQKGEELYARLREHGGIPIDVDDSGVVDLPIEPLAISSGSMRMDRG